MAQLPQHTLHSTVAGKFNLNIRKQKGDTLVRKLTFDNLITDAGLDMMNRNTSFNGVLANCHIGASSQQPSYSDTTLVSWLRWAEADRNIVHEPFAAPGGAAGTRSTAKYRFNPLNSGSGITISEIGVSPYREASATMYSRTLIKDEHGDPSTITILPDEYLDVEYTITFTSANIETFSTLNIRGEAIEVSIKRMRFSPGVYEVNALNGFGGNANESLDTTYYWNKSPVFEHFPLNYTGPDSSWFSATGIARWVGAYVPGSYERFFNIVFSPTLGNSDTGISGMVVGGRFGKFQIKFDPPIKKTAEDTLTLRFKFSWGRA